MFDSGLFLETPFLSSLLHYAPSVLASSTKILGTGYGGAKTKVDADDPGIVKSLPMFC